MTTVQDAPTRDELKEMGVRSLTDVFSSYANEVTNLPVVDLSQLRIMLDRDGQMRSLYKLITAPFISTPINVIPYDKRSTRESAFVKKNLFNSPHQGGMETPIRKVLATMSRTLLEGFGPHEMVWNYDESESKYVLRKIGFRPPDTVKARVNPNNGEFDGFTQRPLTNEFLVPNTVASVGLINKQEININRDKALWFVTNPEFNHIYGKSSFNSAYYHYEKKHKLYYIAHIASQIKATGYRIVKYPENADREQRKNFLDAVAKLGFNSNLLIPPEWEVEVVELKGDVNLLPLINHHDIMASKN